MKRGGANLVVGVLSDFFHLVLIFHRNLDAHITEVGGVVITGPDNIIKVSGGAAVCGSVFTVLLHIASEIGGYVNLHQLVSDFIGLQILKNFITVYCSNSIRKDTDYDENSD